MFVVSWVPLTLTFTRDLKQMYAKIVEDRAIERNGKAVNWPESGFIFKNGTALCIQEKGPLSIEETLTALDYKQDDWYSMTNAVRFVSRTATFVFYAIPTRRQLHAVRCAIRGIQQKFTFIVVNNALRKSYSRVFSPNNVATAFAWLRE